MKALTSGTMFINIFCHPQPAAIEALCLFLEWEITNGEQTQLEIIAALQGSELGQKYYKDLCERQQNLQRLVSVCKTTAVLMSF